MKKVFAMLLIVLCAFVCGCNKTSITNEKETIDVKVSVSNDHKLCEGYKLLLNDYVSIVNYRLSDTFESDNNNGVIPSVSQNLYDQVYGDDKSELSIKWFCMIADMTDYIKTKNIDQFEYILKDINKDNIDEMFWVDSCSNVLAVFTVEDNNAILLDAFWPKYKCVLTDNGYVYTCSVGGAKYNSYELKQLGSDSNSFEIYKSVGVESIKNNGTYVDEYYKTEKGNKIIISKIEYDQFLVDFPFKHTDDWFKKIQILT